jgi:predicted nucleotidyltransferase
MKEMTMLSLASIDLEELCMALEDHSYETSWWIDPRSGAIRFHNPDVDEDTADDLDEAGLVPIEPVDSHDAYRDMEDFVAAVPDRRAADLLDRAIQGRGAFRRFKDTLFEFPELREIWFSFHDTRMRRGAIRWLADNGIVSQDEAEQAAAALPDPPVRGLSPSASAAREVAADLRRVYGPRLAQVLEFGSRARGEESEESDLDLLVVLTDMTSPWEELRRMDDILWRHSQRHGFVVSALPVTQAELERPTSPVLIRASAEAVPVA